MGCVLSGQSVGGGRSLGAASNVVVLTAVARDAACLFEDCSLFDLTLEIPPNPAGHDEGCDTS